jgi:hypothetical protein
MSESAPSLPNPPAAVLTPAALSGILIQSSQRFDQLLVELEDVDQTSLVSHVEGQWRREHSSLA